MGEEKSLTFADRMVIGGRILSDQLVLGDLKALFGGLDVGPKNLCRRRKSRSQELKSTTVSPRRRASKP